MKRSTTSERALVLAPRGRDAALVGAMLGEVGIEAKPCAAIPALIAQLDLGAAFVVVTDEALTHADLSPLDAWLSDQQTWSDLPFVLLTMGGSGIERNPAARRFLEVLRNVTFLERPFHPTTFVSLAKSALRSRRRQYEARARLAALHESETRRATALGIARLGTFEWDLHSGLLTLDERAREILGFGSQQGTRVSDLFDRIHSEDRVRAESQAMTAARNRQRLEMEYRITLPDGGVSVIDSLSDVLGDAGQALQRMVGVIADVSERRAAEQLAAAERDRQRLMLQHMPGFVALLQGPEHRFTYVNDAYVAIAGKRDYIGRTVKDVFSDLDGQGFLELLDRVYETGVPFSSRAMPVRFGNDAPDQRYVDFLYEPVREDEGHVGGIFVGGYDVTEQIQTEVRLRESEARYRTLFENIDEGFCIIEFLDGPEGELSDYVHVAANPAYTAHAGIPNVVGQRVRDMVPAEAGEWVKLYRKVLDDGTPIRFERELLATGRYLELAAFRVEPPSRRQVAVLFQDITVRKRAELALRDINETLERRVAESLAEQKVLADIVEGTDAFVQVVDLEWRWIAVNKAATVEFERIFGVRPMVGQSILDALSHLPEPLREVEAVWRRALAGEEFTVIGELGEQELDRRAYEMKFNLLRDSKGKRIGAYQFAYDVTERLQSQKRLAEAEDALRQAQKMEAVGQLTGGVAHDFNNLLTVIRSSVDLLRRPTVNEERRLRFLDAISDSVGRAAKLTGQLLAFARKQALKPEVFDVVERIVSLSDMLQTLVGARITLETELRTSKCLVEADVSQFETAVVNLAVNARDAMNGEGLLRIAVSVLPASSHPIEGSSDDRHEWAAIDVIDTGLGITPEHLRRIFEPFYTTKEVGKGTGLGLSQAYGFAKQSGGDIKVESAVGQGTRFTLMLPLSRNPAHQGPRRSERDDAAIGSGQGLRILVVEDNADIGSVATQMLQELGYRTVLAANAAEALQMLDRAPEYDVVFSDVVMPGMSGVDLGREIRRRYPDLPVVLASGYSDALVQQGRHGFEMLQKPYAATDLADTLRRIARAQGLEDPAV